MIVLAVGCSKSYDHAKTIMVALDY